MKEADLIVWGELAQLLLAYFIVAFAVQPRKWREHKTTYIWRSPWLYGEALLMGILAGAAQGNWSTGASWGVVLVVMGVHVILDGFRLMAERNYGERSVIFVPTLILHLVVCLAIWVVGTENSEEVIAQGLAFAGQPVVWLIALGYVVLWFPTGYLMRLITLPWQQELPENPKGLARAGQWIGILERTLVLTFVLNDSLASIGLLIAAKSILRFGEIKDHENRKEAEYILIGTLLSFSIAILLGLWLRSVILGGHIPISSKG